DVRGYDAVDPLRLVELLDLVRDPQRSFDVPYARTQWYVPLLAEAPAGDVVLPPLLNMLNVRFLIVRRPPADNVPIYLHTDDYWVLENRSALPRGYVPRRVEVLSDRQDRLTARVSEG